jgi:hypothetical protein
MSDEEDQIATVIFTAELSDPNVPRVEFELTLPQVWDAYRTFHCGGFDDTYRLIAFAGLLMGGLLDANVTNTETSFGEAWYSFGVIFDLPGQEWKTNTDLTLSFCYYLLRQELINRTEAAELGRNIIEDHDRPVTAAEVEAFRKRVDRWAEKQGLPRPGQPRRRTIAA